MTTEGTAVSGKGTNAKVLLDHPVPFGGAGGIEYEAASEWAAEPAEVFQSMVDHRFCIRCLMCVRTCPSISYDPDLNRVQVNQVSCKGCGICVTVCPAKALHHPIYSDGFYGEVLRDHLEPASDPGNSGDVCTKCPVKLHATPEASEGASIRAFCSGKVETVSVLKALNGGHDGVLVFDCFFGRQTGKSVIDMSRRRTGIAVGLLRLLGVDASRVRVSRSTPADREGFERAVADFAGSLAGKKPGGI